MGSDYEYHDVNLAFEILVLCDEAEGEDDVVELEYIDILIELIDDDDEQMVVIIQFHDEFEQNEMLEVLHQLLIIIDDDEVVYDEYDD